MSTPATEDYLFVCDCPERVRSACSREIFFKSSDAKRYCVLHYPGADKAEEFTKALGRKLQAGDFDFAGVWFPGVRLSGKVPAASFKEAEFSSDANFTQADFVDGVNFSQANFVCPAKFIQASFAGPADFSQAKFAGPVDFTQGNFSGRIDFSQTNFSVQVDFVQANFGMPVNFSQAKFAGPVDFSQSVLRDSADFRGAQFANAGFQYAKFVLADFTEAKFALANFIEAEFTQANFVSAEFRQDALFNPIHVSAQTNFRTAKFAGRAYFGRAEVKDAYFGEAEFAATADFGEVQFANSNFEKARFSGRANFGEAKFASDVVFRDTQFKEVDFLKTQFSGPSDFRRTSFGDDAKFEEAVFTKDAIFEDAEFDKNATFFKTKFVPDGSSGKISFDSARFKDIFGFESCDLEGARLSFALATAENPSRVSFRSVNLRPIWFIRFESQDIQFEKVRWLKLKRGRIIPDEIRTLQHENISTPYESLEIVCRQLAVNAEENSRYEEAARFRFVASEAHRRESWHNLLDKPKVLESWKGLNPLLWLYGAVSGYGERAGQAAGVFLAIWFLFALGFYFGQNEGEWWLAPQSSNRSVHKISEPVKPDIISSEQRNEITESSDQRTVLRDFRGVLLYSANVIALQKPEPLPANRRAKFLVLMETLLGPLQLALLALAIRRKFMR